jgi:hypothetical protein
MDCVAAGKAVAKMITKAMIVLIIILATLFLSGPL